MRLLSILNMMSGTKMFYNGLAVWFCKPTTPLQSEHKFSKVYKPLVSVSFSSGGGAKNESNG
jgi:hypothetical protein